MGDHHTTDLPNSNSFESLHIVHDNSLYQSMSSRESQRFSNCVSRLTFVILACFLILSLTIFIAWLAIHPRNPDFRLISFSVSNINLLDSKFAANYNVEFIVDNRKNKKVDLLIDHVKVKVVFDKAMIAEKVLEQIVEVRKMSRGELQAELGRDSVYSVKGKVFKDLSDAWTRKMVNFNVETYVRIGFECGIWPTKQKFLRVLCMNLPVEFLSTRGSGKLMSGGKECLVQLV